MANGNRKWAEGRRVIVGSKTLVEIWDNLALWKRVWKTWNLKVAMSTHLSLCTCPYSCELLRHSLRHYTAAVTACRVTAGHVSHGTLVLQDYNYVYFTCHCYETHGDVMCPFPFLVSN